MDLGLLRSLAQPATTKIILCSLDGLGGLPRPGTGKSELETAALPILHALAARSACGLLRHVGPGITPGSGPGHLGLFGYDPLRHPVGRGVLEALGIDFPLTPGDGAARGNFCTVDGEGRITDRRAGRISSEESAALCGELARITLPGVRVFVETVKEHRFLLVLRGEGLSDAVTETDPQREGEKPLPVHATAPEAEATARLLNDFIAKAGEMLRGREPANMLTLRGIAKRPPMPSIVEACKFRAAAIAAYPMYRGLAKLAGMDVVRTGSGFAAEVA